MAEQEFLIGENTPEIIVRDCEGDLVVEGWAEMRVFIESGEPDSIELKPARLSISLQGDSCLRVPSSAKVIIEMAQGDVRLRAMDVEVKVQSCQGDLRARKCSALTLGEIQGDLRASRISGAIRVKAVQGDASIRYATGGVYVDAQGDVSIPSPVPEAQVVAAGDLLLSLAPKAGSNNMARSQGNLRCLLQLPASVTVNYSAQGEIWVRPPISGKGEKTNGAIALGASEATLQLESNGTLEIGGWMDTEYFVDWEKDLGRMGADLGAVAGEWGRWVDGMIRDKLEDAERSFRKYMAGADFPRPRARAGWESNPARSRGSSERERMSVLQMLQEGKITVDEADRLLSALGGRRVG
jgi:hypothetical protein